MKTRTIIAGQDVAAAIAAHKAAVVLPSPIYAGSFDSESLCAHQREMSRRGYVEAEIVKSNYGFSLRYASGLQNFGLIATAREIGGSFEAAIAYAETWQAASPAFRFVSLGFGCPGEEG